MIFCSRLFYAKIETARLMLDNAFFLCKRLHCVSFVQLSDAKEIKATLQELESRNSKLEATLSRIAAPNMKAIDRCV